jgi:hexosaminidase
MLSLALAVPLVSCAKPAKVQSPGPTPAATPPTAPATVAPPAAAPAPAAAPTPAASAPHALIPVPVSVELGQGPAFVVTAATRILVPPGDERAAAVGKWLSAFIHRAVAPDPPRVETFPGDAPAGSIQLRLGSRPDAGDEGYELTITGERVTIVANKAAGLFYGVQTLRQLLPPFLEYDGVLPGAGGPVSAPAARIVDRPRYAWRGAMLDVARHFVSVADVKRYIDYLALYKMNRLHLHLTDDQGWRIEITSWPNLTTHGGSTGVGGGPGGYYTQQQYADIVAYAAERFIAIVPEVDLPSHINAALSAYPELNCDGKAPPPYTGIEVGFSVVCVDKDVTYKFIDDVVREIGALTPTPWFHLGGDEVKKLTDEQYARFVERVQGIVVKHGKTVVGWDEIAASTLVPGAIVQHWRPENVPSRAVSKGAKVILSPANKIYLDMKYHDRTVLGLDWAGLVEVPEAYSWDPLTMFAGLAETSILGIEAAIWSETLATLRDVEYMAFPRFAGAAEIAWSPAASRQWDEYKMRLAAQAARWSVLGINYYRAPSVPWPQ